MHTSWNQGGLMKFNEAVTQVVESGEAAGIVALVDNGSETHVATAGTTASSRPQKSFTWRLWAHPLPPSSPTQIRG